MAALNVETQFTESGNNGIQVKEDTQGEPNAEQKKEERMIRLRDLHLRRVCCINNKIY